MRYCTSSRWLISTLAPRYHETPMSWLEKVVLRLSQPYCVALGHLQYGWYDPLAAALISRQGSMYYMALTRAWRALLQLGEPGNGKQPG